VQLDYGLLRATADAVDALARLDESARVAPSVAHLLTLRSAQTILAENERPPVAAAAAAREPGDAPAVEPEGANAFAALLAGWYAPESRAFIVEDPALRAIAAALDEAAAKLRDGRALTAGLLDEAMRTADLDADNLPPLLDATLSVAEHEGWPALVLAADLASGACGRERGVAASMARAVTPLADHLVAFPYVVPSPAPDAASALHAVAREAHGARRRLVAYRAACAAAEAQCTAFGRGAPTATALVRFLAGHPAVSVARAMAAVGVSAPAANAAVDRLVEAELLRELTGRRRDRVFVYTPAIAFGD
jgi:hypothetical protein